MNNPSFLMALSKAVAILPLKRGTLGKRVLLLFSLTLRVRCLGT